MVGACPDLLMVNSAPALVYWIDSEVALHVDLSAPERKSCVYCLESRPVSEGQLARVQS